jgi:hypothetical protein
VLGRGALLLAAGAFNLTMWAFGALLALFGFLSSIKATTERATEAWLRRKKARRSRRRPRQACRQVRLWRALSRRARLAVIARSSIPIPKHGTDDAEFSQRRCRNCLSRRRRG